MLVSTNLLVTSQLTGGGGAYGDPPPLKAPEFRNASLLSIPLYSFSWLRQAKWQNHY